MRKNNLQVSHCLKIADHEIVLCGARPLNEYDFVRRVLREKRKLVLTATLLTNDCLKIRQFLYIDKITKKYMNNISLREFCDYINSE